MSSSPLELVNFKPPFDIAPQFEGINYYQYLASNFPAAFTASACLVAVKRWKQENKRVCACKCTLGSTSTIPREDWQMLTVSLALTHFPEYYNVASCIAKGL
jgi:hypothetical protein